MNLLEIQDVSYHYNCNTKMVLDKINASFEEGNVYGIIGKSGAGKSTLLSLLSGLDTVTQGKILYQGTDIAKLNLDQYRSKSIGVIFQGYNLLTNATAVENIVLSMEISGSKETNKKAFALGLLQKIGIDKDTANRKVLKLSGGEQQRVAIARALAHKPDIIIADEPSGNLDVDTEKDIIDTLLALAHEEGKCVIIVTHSQKVAARADVLWGLNSGKLCFIR